MASSPRDNLRELLRRSLEAGRSLPHLSRVELEEMIRELGSSGSIGREKVEDAIEEIRARSRRGVDHLADLVRTEIRKEVARESRRRRDELIDLVGQGIDTLAEAVNGLLREEGGHGAHGERTPGGAAREVPDGRTEPAPTTSGRKAPAKKAPAKKAPAKKATAATKAPARKSTAKKATARKAPARKSTAKTNAAGRTRAGDSAGGTAAKKTAATDVAGGATVPVAPRHGGDAQLAATAPEMATPTPVHRIGLVVHPERPAAKELALRARSWWEAHGCEVVDAPEELLEPGMRVFTEPVDFAISLGGDGTMLRTLQGVVADRVPVLGVNLGNLGYLTGIEPIAVEHAFEQMERGEFEIEERMTLSVEVRDVDGSVALAMPAVNEAVVEKTSPGHTIRIHAAIAERAFLTYVADGIVVSTPTGTTAYNLSIRGPIVSPGLRAIVLTPISPHMLFDRALVLEPEERVDLELAEGRPAVLVVDGMNVATLGEGDRVGIAGGAEPARFVRFGDQDFHAILRAKFGLADR